MSYTRKVCAISSCKRIPTRGTPFHKFPKGSVLRKRWASLCKIKLSRITPHTGICGCHFVSENYFPTRDGRRKALKHGVIPSQNLPPQKYFLPNPDKLDQIVQRQNRLIKRNQMKQELLQKAVAESKNSLEQLTSQSNHELNSIISEDHVLNPDLDEKNSTSLETSSLRDYIENSECPCMNNETRTKETLAVMALLELSKVDSADLPVIYKKGQECCDHLIQEKSFTLMNLIKSDESLKAFTGVNFTCFNNLVKCLELSEQTKFHGAVDERVLMCLCKLKLNLSFVCLSVLFQWSERVCAKYFYDMVLKLSQILKDAVYWPDKEEIVANLPKCFEKFKDTRIVLDCTESPVEKPGCLNCRLRLYSHYKGLSTVKFMVGISPGGQIIHISTGFGGRASDKAIFDHSNVVEKLLPCIDSIMVDKGFSIEEECLRANIKLQMPPKLGKQEQFNTADFEKTKEIAAARVHVERIIQRIKLYKIFSDKIEWTLVPYIDEIILIICGLVNWSRPILSNDKYMFP